MAEEQTEKQQKLEKKPNKNDCVDFICLFGFYGISTFVDYLMPKSIFIKNSYISNDSIKHKYTV